MVDILTYEQIHPAGQTPERQYGGPDVEDEEPPEDHFLLLLPATIRGFGFHDKKWRKHSIQNALMLRLTSHRNTPSGAH
jgi:hypothetical protein